MSTANSNAETGTTVHLVRVGEGREAVTRNRSQAKPQKLHTYEVCVDGTPIGRVRAVIEQTHRKSGRIIVGTSEAKRWRVDDGAARPVKYDQRADAVRDVLDRHGWSGADAYIAAKNAAVAVRTNDGS